MFFIFLTIGHFKANLGPLTRRQPHLPIVHTVSLVTRFGSEATLSAPGDSNREPSIQIKRAIRLCHFLTLINLKEKITEKLVKVK